LAALPRLAALFADNILPILIVAGAGFTLQRLLHVDPRPLSQVIFYAFTPCFVYTLLVGETSVTDQILRMVALAALVMAAIGVLSYAAARLARLDRRSSAAVILSSTFMNAGNYGLSLSLFAFGDSGRALASLFFLTSAVFTNSLGVYVASAGSLPPLAALKGLLRVPSLYAVPAALIVRAASWTVPVTIQRPIDLLSQATIPAMLLLLGMQIANAGLPSQRGPLLMTAGLRLIASPAIALALAPILGLTLVARQAGVIEAAMPTAVLATVIALEFDAQPDFVTGAVLATTLLSPLTITPLLLLLGA
jgi:predicted permease